MTTDIEDILAEYYDIVAEKLWAIEPIQVHNGGYASPQDMYKAFDAGSDTYQEYLKGVNHKTYVTIQRYICRTADSVFYEVMKGGEPFPDEQRLLTEARYQYNFDECIQFDNYLLVEPKSILAGLRVYKLVPLVRDGETLPILVDP